MCTGSALAVRAGILTGKKATTNKSAWPSKVNANPHTTWVPDARWVEDYSSTPPRWSCSWNVTAGLDLMLISVEQVCTKEDSVTIARVVEHVGIKDPGYDPFARTTTRVNLRLDERWTSRGHSR
jgi:transcriptional regulator GlxA family with amidase domain